MAPERENTKDRLLDAAEQLFGARPFDDVSVRELAGLAKVNAAAVNYHFQSKENLFHEVMIRRFAAQRDRTLTALDSLLLETEGRPTVEEVVRALAGQYLAGALGDRADRTFLTFMAREMAGGHGASSSVFFRELVAPVFQAFSKALQAARPQLTEEERGWIVASIIGQIHHFIMRWQKRNQLAGQSEAFRFLEISLPAVALPLSEYVSVVTAHIARFSAAAVGGMYPEVHP